MTGSAPFFRWLLSFGNADDLTKKPAPPVAANNRQQSLELKLINLKTDAPDDSSAWVISFHECSALNRPAFSLPAGLVTFFGQAKKVTLHLKNDKKISQHLHSEEFKKSNFEFASTFNFHFLSWHKKLSKKVKAAINAPRMQPGQRTANSH